MVIPYSANQIFLITKSWGNDEEYVGKVNKNTFKKSGKMCANWIKSIIDKIYILKIKYYKMIGFLY